MMIDTDGLILCGGEGKRMGGIDKGLLPFLGRPLVAHVLALASSWPLGHLMISANRNRARYALFDLPVLADVRSGFCGPMAGIEAGLLASQAEALLILPCDVPYLPADLFYRLYEALAGGAEVAYISDPFHDYPNLCLIRRSQLTEISRRLDEGRRSLWRWQTDIGAVAVRIEQQLPNLNTPQALAAAEAERGDARELQYAAAAPLQ
ncbi:molybdenum cofactor guanylyltransferase MobA [Chitinimonas lacunae]|uniref:Molybdenum cofactor guanylyltransferase n=1 Tax=Chitinimonas lacunae TaxID=1963018 RepID=A0ABV8MPQ0_9NEIS